MELDEKLQKFSSLLKDKKNQLANTSCPATFGQAEAKSDALKDGEYLADGGDIEQLAGAHTEDRRRDIARQMAALEKVIAILQNNRRHALKEAIQEACKNLPESVKEVFENVIDSAQNLVDAIEQAIEVSNILDKKGIESTRRPQSLRVIPFWVNMVRSMPGTPTLPFMIENQKRNWEN